MKDYSLCEFAFYERDCRGIKAKEITGSGTFPGHYGRDL